MKILRVGLVALVCSGLCACDPFSNPHATQAPSTKTASAAPAPAT